MCSETDIDVQALTGDLDFNAATFEERESHWPFVGSGLLFKKLKKAQKELCDMAPFERFKHIPSNPPKIAQSITFTAFLSHYKHPMSPRFLNHKQSTTDNAETLTQSLSQSAQWQNLYRYSWATRVPWQASNAKDLFVFLLQLQSYKSYFEKEKYPFMQKMNYKLKKNPS